MKRSIIPAILVLIGCVALLFAPVQIPHSISASARVMPAKEWILSRNLDGRLLSSLYNYQVGNTSTYTVTEPQRGDAVNFMLNPEIHAFGVIHEGDLIGRLHSNEMERHIAQLSGQIEVKRALLAMYESGEKDAVVSEAEQRLLLAERELAEQRGVTERLRMLFERDLVAQEEFELSENALEMKRLNVSIAEAQLRAVQSGVKDEELNLARAEIRALESELRSVQKQLQDFEIKAPFTGVLLSKFGSRSLTDEVMVRLADTSKFILLIPVPWTDHDLIERGHSVHISLPNGDNRLYGQVVQVDNTVQILDGRQMVFVTAEFEAPPGRLMPGMLARARISVEPMTPLAHTSRFLGGIFSGE